MRKSHCGCSLMNCSDGPLTSFFRVPWSFQSLLMVLFSKLSCQVTQVRTESNGVFLNATLLKGLLLENHTLSSFSVHYRGAVKQGTKPCNRFMLYQEAVLNVSNCENTNRTDNRERSRWVDYWLKELRLNRQVRSAFSRRPLINWSGGSCWWIVNKTSLLFCFGGTWLLSRAVDLFSKWINVRPSNAALMSKRQLLWEVHQPSSITTSCKVW